MDFKKISEIIDQFSGLNAILEICRGYTQADQPDMRMLESVLFNLGLKYREIYKQMCFLGERGGLPTMNKKFLSELTNEDLRCFKYPNLMAEVKETTYSICTIAEHMGLARPYRNEDDPETWAKLTGKAPILGDEALGLSALFNVDIEYLFSHELKVFNGMSAAYWRWFNERRRISRETEITQEVQEIEKELEEKPYLLKAVKHMVTWSNDQIDEFIEQLTRKERDVNNE